MSESKAVMAQPYMWEISHGQAIRCGIFRQSRRPGFVCDISSMASKLDIQAIRETIVAEMERKGFSRRKLSLHAGIGQTAIRDLLERTENPGIGTLHKVAEALDLPFEAISGSAAVPLMGRIGAGGSVAFFKDDHEVETVPRPPLAPGPLMALEVHGDSMLPKYEPGDIVYVRRDHEGVLPAYLGRYCAVALADGGTYLKVLAPGTSAGRYTLRSLNAADMENVEVLWASPVLFVMPRH
jgi:phage repressor protein C with HTH and peptisase S24 domain